MPGPRCSPGTVCSARCLRRSAHWLLHCLIVSSRSESDEPSMPCEPCSVLYGLVGCAVWLLYRRLPAPDAKTSAPPAPLRHSRGTVWRLAALFSVDSFAGGLVVNSLLALWLFQRFQESLSATAASSSGPGCLPPSPNWRHRTWPSASAS